MIREICSMIILSLVLSSGNLFSADSTLTQNSPGKQSDNVIVKDSLVTIVGENNPGQHSDDNEIFPYSMLIVAALGLVWTFYMYYSRKNRERVLEQKRSGEREKYKQQIKDLQSEIVKGTLDPENNGKKKN